MSRTLTIAEQIRLLIDTLTGPNGRPYPVSTIAEVSGLTTQTLMNLLHNRILNPRLDTLRALCGFYGVSLAYFDTVDEEVCRAFLEQERQRLLGPPLQQLDTDVKLLSVQSQERLRGVMEWMEVSHEHGRQKG